MLKFMILQQRQNFSGEKKKKKKPDTELARGKE